MAKQSMGLERRWIGFTADQIKWMTDESKRTGYTLSGLVRAIVQSEMS